MSADHSVTLWIAGLKNGDELAAHAIWERYFEQLRAVARTKLGTVPQRVQDDEDLARVAPRLAHEPLAYITGRRDFWTISLTVAPGVLIPRPDSET